MNQNKREKIAVLVFLALMIISTTIIVNYINHVGTSWNHTATRIDDARGELIDYTAIIYRGTAIPETRKAAEETQPISIVSAVRVYKEKGANVLRIDVLHPEIYDGGDIYLIGHKRIGLFYVSDETTKRDLREQVEYYFEHAVDHMVFITEDSEFIQDSKYRPDIVISIGANEDVRFGTTIDGTYYSHVPSVGKVGAILISPDNIISSKTITEIKE